jgi:hypothetical protein
LQTNVSTLLQISLRGISEVAQPSPHPDFAFRAHRPALMLDYKNHSRGLTSQPHEPLGGMPVAAEFVDKPGSQLTRALRRHEEKSILPGL